MTTFVVDTNVAIVANGRQTHADSRCQLDCVKALKVVITQGIIAIDNGVLIIEEYTKRLNFSGMSGVGDKFLKYVLDHKYRGDKVRRVAVMPSDDDGRGFEELPKNAFDPSDRKFLAVAVVVRAAVLNATDSDWDEHKALMNDLQVRVIQLCPQHASKNA